MGEEGRKVVCVTGGSGYIASWLVKHLLQRGYTVKATVRDMNDPKETQHLLALDGAEERLQLFEADLLDEGTFDAAVDGCEGVFHTASPVIFSSTDPQTELTDPAVKGTLNVLKSCARVHSVKRVILTSSIAAVVFDGKSHLSEMMIDEAFHSDPAFCRQQKVRSVDILVIGPLLQPTLNSTVEMILNLVNGAQAYPDAYYKSVDDVADVHIKAFEVPTASGRYCLVADITHFGEIVKIIRQLYPALHLPDKSEESEMYISKFPVSNEKVKTLGIDFIPLEMTLKDTIECLKEKGFFRESETSM